MKKITKKVAKGLPVGIRVRKPRYYYQDITATYNTSATENIDLVEFEGLDYGLSYSTLTFKNKKLWNNKQYSGSTRALAPLYENNFVRYGGYSVVGSLTNDNNVFSGFNGSNYLSLNGGFEVGDKTWEVVAKFTTTASFPNLQGIYHFHNALSDSGRYGLIIRMQGNKFNFVASSGYSWLFNATGSYTLQPNTTYWVKASFNGSRYVLSYSLDGKDYIEDISYSSSSPLLSGLNIMVAGVWYTGSSYYEPLLGTLDLNECYMKMGGNFIWLPKITEENQQYTPEYLTINKGFIYNVVGNPTITNGVLSELSSSDYIKIPSISLGKNDWEISLKATTPSDVASNEYSIWDLGISDSNTIRIGSAATVKGRWQLLIRVNNNWINASSQTGSHTVQPNTTYWIKAGFNSSTNTYYLKYSLDGVDYIDDVSYTSTTITPSTSGNSISKTWSGEIYLDECKVTVNGVKVWGKDAKSVIAVAGCLDEGLYENYNETTYNAFVKDNDILLTNKEDVEGMIWANKVIVPEHLKSAIYKPNYTQKGTLGLDLLYNASDFSANNYILSPSVITEPENNTYLLVTRVTTGDDSNSRNIFWTNSSPDYGCGTTGSNTWRFWRGSTYTGGSYEYNTSYWVAVMQYPDQTILYYMKDDGTFKDISKLPLPVIRGGGTQPYWSTGPTYNGIVYGAGIIRIGTGYASTGEYWEGSLDLANTVIYKNYNNMMANTETVWKPLTPISE